jgi:hypothetical protein
VLVELQEVVGRADQAPFGANGGPAPSVKAIQATVELGLGEHRLDELLSLSIELAAVVGVEHPAHEGVEATVPAGSRRLASAGVRRDQHPDAVGDDAFHLVLVPIAGVREHDLRILGDAGGVKLAAGRVEDRFEMAEVGRVDGDLGGDELPEELATQHGRRGWLRDAQQRLDERRAREAKPISRWRPERLKESKRRLEEELWAECQANKNYEA